MKLIIVGLVCTSITILAGMTVPYLTKIIIDEVLIVEQFEKLGYFSLLLMAAALVKAITTYTRSYLLNDTSQRVIYDLRSQIYDKLQFQSFEFYDKIRTGLLMNRVVGDLNAIRMVISNGYMQIFESSVMFIATLIIMTSMSVKLTLAMLVILPLIYLNTRRMAKLLFPIFSKVRAAFEDLTSSVQENVTGIRVVKGMGREEYEKERFKKIAWNFTDKNLDVADVRAKYNPLHLLYNGLGLVIILLFGGYLTINGDITIGTLVAFNSYMFMLKRPISSIGGLINQWERAAASLEKVFSLIDEEPVIQNKKDPVVLKKTRGDIIFKNVYFKYNEEYVLKNINVHMKPGSVTAVMGATGSGKSTIINLMARFYDCTKGHIKIDGYNVKELEMNSLRKHIGIILQETFLFSDTIAENISFGRPGATQEEIERAARIADAHGFIMEMPEKYNTVVGERGIGLSGGQKQRIAIARAILYDPEILILDDATSSVDMETEQEIQKTLKQVMKNRTTLIIAHRISSVKSADHIIYMHNGRIIEEGTHDELMKIQGSYYDTYVEQYESQAG